MLGEKSISSSKVIKTQAKTITCCIFYIKIFNMWGEFHFLTDHSVFHMVCINKYIPNKPN